MEPAKTIEVKLVDSAGNMFCPLHVCLDSYRGGRTLNDGDVLKVETFHSVLKLRYDSSSDDFTELNETLKEPFGV